MKATTVDPKTFFDLEPEVRIQIYSALFRCSETIVLNPVPLCAFSATRAATQATRIPLHAMRISRQFREEASAILYGYNRFHMHWSASFMARGNLSQTFQSIVSLDLCCCPAWHCIDAIKHLAEIMPALRSLNLRFADSWILLAAVLELSNAATACTALFPAPDIRLCASILDSQPVFGIGATHRPNLNRAILKKSSRLQDILPDPAPEFGLLLQSDLPKLTVIRLVGKLSTSMLAEVEQHRCVLGDCSWVETGEEDNAKHSDMGGNYTRKYYRWQALGCEGRGPRPEVGMLQWYPDLPESYRAALRKAGENWEWPVASVGGVEGEGMEDDVGVEENVDDGDESEEDAFWREQLGVFADGLLEDDESTA